MTCSLHAIIKYVIAVVLLSVTICGHANTNVTVLLSGKSQLYYDAAGGLEQALNNTEGVDYSISIISDLSAADRKAIDSASDYVVAVGTRALQFVVTSQLSSPVISILVPRKTYQTLVGKTHRDISVIYLEQPPKRFVLLSRFILKERLTKLGMLFGPDSITDRTDYVTAASDLAIQLVSLKSKSANASLEAIESVIKDADMFVALYDREALSRKTAKWLLYMANVYRKPVIAYSRSYIEAGALAAVYTMPVDAGKMAAEWILENNNHQRVLVWQRYPDRFSVDINRSIASRLNIIVDDAEIIKNKIKVAEVKK